MKLKSKYATARAKSSSNLNSKVSLSVKEAASNLTKKKGSKVRIDLPSKLFYSNSIITPTSSVKQSVHGKN